MDGKNIARLDRQLKGMKKELARKRTENPDFPPKSCVLDYTIRSWLTGKSLLPEDPLSGDVVREIGLFLKKINVSSTIKDVAGLSSQVYGRMDVLPGVTIR